MTATEHFKPIFGEWITEGSFELGGTKFEPRGRDVIEPFGEFVLIRSTVDLPEFPDGMMFIGGRSGEGPPFLMHYFDERGVHRRWTTSFEDRVWHWRRHPDDDWKDGSDGPGFDQRAVGEMSEDGKTMEFRYERSEDGETWELDFPLSYTRA